MTIEPWHFCKPCFEGDHAQCTGRCGWSGGDCERECECPSADPTSHLKSNEIHCAWPDCGLLWYEHGVYHDKAPDDARMGKFPDMPHIKGFYCPNPTIKETT